MTNRRVRKRLAEMGFLFNGARFTYDPNPDRIRQNIVSGMYKLPKKRKRLKLSDF